MNLRKILYALSLVGVLSGCGGLIVFTLSPTSSSAMTVLRLSIGLIITGLVLKLSSESWD